MELRVEDRGVTRKNWGCGLVNKMLSGVRRVGMRSQNVILGSWGRDLGIKMLPRVPGFRI